MCRSIWYYVRWFEEPAKGCHMAEPADADVNIIAGRDDGGRPQSLRHEVMHFSFR
jgi:hypothetical protein